MRFDAELRRNGKTATGIPVPERIIDELGGGRRPQVTVSVNGHTFRTSLGTMSGQVLMDRAGQETGDPRSSAGGDGELLARPPFAPLARPLERRGVCRTSSTGP